MKFGCIISECGLNPTDYPHTSEIAIEVFDCKNHKISEPLKFAKEIFSENLSSKKEFIKFLNTLEKNKVSGVVGTVKIFEDAIMLYFPHQAPKLFLR